METNSITMEVYSNLEGNLPFKEWLNNLEDSKTQAVILKRLRKLELGNLGDFKFFNQILELRIDYGSGYRIYCGKKENSWIILLVAGSKKTQSKDIETAKTYWEDWKKRHPTKHVI